MGLAGQTLWGTMAKLAGRTHLLQQDANAFRLHLTAAVGFEPEVTACAGLCCSRRRTEEQAEHDQWEAKARYWLMVRPWQAAE